MTKPFNPWYVIAATAITVIIVNIDATALYLAVKQISIDYSVSLTTTQWVANAYLLTCIIFLIPGGRLADLIGRRTVYLIGTGLFLIGSLCCALGTDFTTLLIGRGIQGIGFAWTLPLSLILAKNAFPKDQQAKALAIVLFFSGLAQAIGPSLGGLALTYLSWRILFWLNVPLCLISILLTIRFSQEIKIQHSERFDLIGVLLLAPTVFVIIFAFNQVAQWGFASWQFIVLLCAGLLFACAFLIRLRQSAHPLIDRNIFSNPAYIGYILVRFFYLFNWSSLAFLLPLFMMTVLRFSILQASIAMLCATVMTMISSRLSSVVIGKLGIPITQSLSLALAFGSFISFLTFNQNMPSLQLCITLAFYGTSVGLFLNSSVSGALNSVEDRRQAIASGVLYTIAFSGSAIGVALSGLALSTKSTQYLIAQLGKINVHLAPALLDNLQHFACGTRNLSDLNFAGLPANIDNILQLSFQDGFHAAMAITTTCALISLLLSGICYINRKNNT